MGTILDLADQLNQCKPILYSSELLKFDELKSKYSQQKLSLTQYAQALLDYAEQLDYSGRPLDDLKNFFIYHESASTVNHNREHLLQAAQAADQLLRKKLYTSSYQVTLDQMITRLQIMEKLLNISLTSKELQEVRQNRHLFFPDSFITFLQTVNQSYHADFLVPIDHMTLTNNINQALFFYDVADKRSTAMVNNLLRAMHNRDENHAVLISGGFHAEHIQHQLEQLGITFFSIRPTLTDNHSPNPYYSILTNKHQPIEKLLNRIEKNFAPASAFYDANFLHYLSTIHEIIKEYTFTALQGLSGESYTRAQQAYTAVKQFNDPSVDLNFVKDKSDPQKGIYVFIFAHHPETAVVIRPVGATAYPTLIQQAETLPATTLFQGRRLQLEFVAANLLNDQQFLQAFYKQSTSPWLSYLKRLPQLGWDNLIAYGKSFSTNVQAVITFFATFPYRQRVNRLVTLIVSFVIILPLFMVNPSATSLEFDLEKLSSVFPLLLMIPNVEQLYFRLLAMFSTPKNNLAASDKQAIVDQMLATKVKTWCAREYGYAPLPQHKHLHFTSAINHVITLAEVAATSNNQWLHKQIFPNDTTAAVDLEKLSIFAMIYHEASMMNDEANYAQQQFDLLINHLSLADQLAKDSLPEMTSNQPFTIDQPITGSDFFSHFMRLALSSEKLQVPTIVKMIPFPGIPFYSGFLAQQLLLTNEQKQLISAICDHPSYPVEIEQVLPFPSKRYVMYAWPGMMKARQVYQQLLTGAKELGVSRISLTAYWDSFPRALAQLQRLAQTLGLKITNHLSSDNSMNAWTNFLLFLSWPARHHTIPILLIGVGLLSYSAFLMFITASPLLLLLSIGIAFIAVASLLWGSYHYFTHQRLVITIDSADYTNRDFLAARLAQRFGLLWVSDQQIKRALAYLMLNYQIDVADDQPVDVIKDQMERLFSAQGIKTKFYSHAHHLHFFDNIMDITDHLNTNRINQLLYKIDQHPELAATLTKSANNYLLQLRNHHNLVVSGLNTGNLFGSTAQKRIWMMPPQSIQRAVRLYQHVKNRPPRNRSELTKAHQLLRRQDRINPPLNSIHTFDALWDVSTLDLGEMDFEAALDRASAELQHDLHQLFSFKARWRAWRERLLRGSTILTRNQGEQMLLNSLQKDGNLLVALWDLDGLGSFNHIYGKQAVNVILDDLLQTFNQSLQTLPQLDSLNTDRKKQIRLIRHGGDEIYLHLPTGITREDLTLIGRHIKTTISRLLHQKYIFLTPTKIIDNPAIIRFVKEALKQDKAIHVIDDDLYGLRFLVEAKTQQDLKAIRNHIAKLEVHGLLANNLVPLNFLDLLENQQRDQLDIRIGSYLNTGHIVTPSVSGGSLEALQAKPVAASDQSSQVFFEKWMHAISAKITHPLHIAKNTFGKFHFHISQPDNDQYDLSEDQPDFGLALSRKANAIIASVEKEFRAMGRMLLYDKKGKPY